MVHASLYLLGILLVAVNYALMYPVQSMVLLLTWQLAKYLVWFCSPSPASQSMFLVIKTESFLKFSYCMYL